MKKPKISIILPTYNRAPYLKRCVTSVLEQGFRDWELLIVDDGSSDETFEVINPYLFQHSNIRYLKHQNQKLPRTKNIGIQTSFGEYITFLDSDDRYEKDHLESRLEIMNTHQALDLVEGGFKTTEEVWVVDFFDPTHTRMINIQDCVLGPTFFGKREVFVALDGFQDLAYGEDTDFWMRAEKRFKTLKIHEPKTYLYSRAEESITKAFEKNRFQSPST